MNSEEQSCGKSIEHLSPLVLNCSCLSASGTCIKSKRLNISSNLHSLVAGVW